MVTITCKSLFPCSIDHHYLDKRRNPHPKILLLREYDLLVPPRIVSSLHDKLRSFSAMSSFTMKTAHVVLKMYLKILVVWELIKSSINSKFMRRNQT